MSVLDDGRLAILAWIGPCNEQITPKSMADLAGAGFNLSLSAVTPERLVESLDMAADAGIRLVIGLPNLRITRPGQLSDSWFNQLRDIVLRVRNHKGLFGYYVADEPRVNLLEDIGRVSNFLLDLDPEHVAYINHWAVSMTYTGARGFEDLWERYFRLVPRGQLVSSDLYPFRVVTEEDWQQHRGDPYYFPHIKARMEVPYFEMLDFLRQFSFRWQRPMWNCVFSTGVYSPATTEGEVQFQLMMSLAYGAVGVQYFSYSHGNMMIESDLTPNANWHNAKKLNAVLRAWEPVFMKLRSIGVYHHPANLQYTRALDQFLLGGPTDLVSRGDPVVVGHFLDGEQNEYVLIVNRSPYDPAAITFHFGTDGEVLECSPKDASFARPWPYVPRKMPLTFAPGQGRLFKFKREIAI